MSTEINLLPHKSRGRFSQEQLLVYTKVLAVMSCILTVSLSLMFFLLNRDPALAQIEAQQKTILAQLNALHSKTAKNLIILDRVKRIAKINQSRKSLDKTINQVQQEVPNGAAISTFNLDEKSLSITVTAQSLSPIGEFIENLTKDVQNKQLFKKVSLQGVISDEKTGTFLMSISCDLL